MAETSIRGIAEIVLWVHSMEASLRFYRDTLRLPVLSPPEMRSPIFLRAGQGADVPQMIVLVQLPTDAPPFGKPRSLHHLALEIPAAQFDAEQKRFEAAGFSVRSGKHPVVPSRTMYVDDPDGNEVELICAV